MSTKFCKAASLVAVVLALGMSVAWGWSQVTAPLRSTPMQHTDPTSALATSSEIDTTWRHTKLGWQDSASWPAADTYAPKKTIELLHPLVWAAFVLISVIATMIWASNEWEFKRLFAQDSHEVDLQRRRNPELPSELKR